MAHMSLEDRLPRGGEFANIEMGEVLYRNDLSRPDDISTWRLEGQAGVTFPNRRMRLESVLPREQGQKANYVLWCPRHFPDGLCIEFDFHPVREPGLAMFWLCARWHDQGAVGGPALLGGKIGFRQMAPLVAEYANLVVRSIGP